MGHLVRPGDEKEPKKVAWLQCVGRRDVNTCDHPYCSSVCCMYAIKEATDRQGAQPRRPGRGHLLHGHAHLWQGLRAVLREGQGLRRALHPQPGALHHRAGRQVADDLEYATEDGQAKTEDFDMVVLSQGLEVDPASGRALPASWACELKPAPSSSRRAPSARWPPAVRASMSAAPWPGPKDIPQSVMEASAAACAAGGQA